MAGAAILRNRAVLALGGNDAREFLNGLVTSDVGKLAPRQALYAALLTPQGKILFDFIIVEHGPELLLDCAAVSAEDLIKRLGFYRLRADVTIALRSDLSVAAIWDVEPPPPDGSVLTFHDPRLAGLGVRLIGDAPAIERAIATVPSGDYEEFRLRLGIPESADLPPDEVFALDAGMADLNGVSFTKGCYVGQEVTARMKHRATARRRFCVVNADQVPPPGTVIAAEGRELGRISSAHHGLGLALVRLDRLSEAKAANIPIIAGTTPVSLRPPEWTVV